MIERVILIVLDSVGIGSLPDASNYGDEDSNTLSNIAKFVGKLNIPNLIQLGISCIPGVNYIETTSCPFGAFGRALEKSAGKDTTTGHWEISGIILKEPFPTYPKGFPPEIIEEFEWEIGTRILGNKPASGTKIIEELGDEHVRTGCPIVYTSADSVFQIASHESIISIEKLYEICQTARKILTGNHGVSRVIARPFTGISGSYKRTDRRKDFSIKPVKPTMLNLIKDAGYSVKGVGKIEDIFADEGLTDSIHTYKNIDGIKETIKHIKEKFKGLLFTNLVDFDMLFGHRNDVEGYAKALEEFDSYIPQIINAMYDEDILIITADHGCDPTTKSTDHSREYIPVLLYGRTIKPVSLGTLESFADIGKTVCDILKTDGDIDGKSFKNLIVS